MLQVTPPGESRHPAELGFPPADTKGEHPRHPLQLGLRNAEPLCRASGRAGPRKPSILSPNT